MARFGNRGGQLFCWLFMLIGVALVGLGVWTLIKSLRTERWPVTDGVIQSAEQKTHSGHDGATYSAAVTYTYRVAGVSYEGSKISIGQMSSSADYARRILSRYPVGKKVPVYYSPTNPTEAVLETGIHGGTWICFGVGTAFVLFAALFLQIQRAVAKAQMTGMPQSSTTPTNPTVSVSMDKPPVLLGVIFLFAGGGICFAQPSSGTPNWIVFAAGGMFGFMGIYLLLIRLEDKVYSRMALLLGLALFMAIFHWVSFGVGERIGTSSTPFLQRSGVSVKTPFAIFTIIVDVLIVAGFIRWLLKRRNE